MRTPAHNSISRKLTWMNMLVSGTALLLACGAFFAYDQLTFRQNLARSLSAQAQIVGTNSISALLFNDPQAATNTLSALSSSTNIVSAEILTPDGKPFAKFVRDGDEDILALPALQPGQSEAYLFQGHHLVLVHAIQFHGKTVGFVHIRSDLRGIDQRLKRYAAIAFAVLLLCLAAARLVSWVFGKTVSTPIVRLAGVARTVSNERDYSVRAEPSYERDELGLLVNSFNDMLAEIQRRDQELQQAHDQLERRVAERTRELVASNRELEAFSYSVSHDLRGPVDALDGYTYVLLKEYAGKLDSKVLDLVERIRNSGRRMTQLIDDLLTLSRVTSSAMEREPVDLTAIAHSIADELSRGEPERQVQFVIANVQKVEGDPRLLTLAMENLLRNAWKYTSHHPTARIEFGSQRKNGELICFVRDDGAGFDPRSADRLFQPFQRLHSVEEFAGNGVGLATVQRVIRRHGGDVWAVGEVNKGATFYFRFGKGNVPGDEAN